MFCFALFLNTEAKMNFWGRAFILLNSPMLHILSSFSFTQSYFLDPPPVPLRMLIIFITNFKHQFAFRSFVEFFFHT